MLKFPTHDGVEYSLYDLFLGHTNVQHISANLRKNVKLDTMKSFLTELEIGQYDSVNGDITESLSFLNNLFLKQYGSDNDKLHTIRKGKYPKLELSNKFNYNDLYSFRALDAQFDQKTMRDNSQFRFKNKIVQPWQLTGHKNRHNTENTGLRGGTFQEKESINRGYAMETILDSNRYNKKPQYYFDTTLGADDRLQ